MGGTGEDDGSERPADLATNGGTYSLLIRLENPTTIEVGALGERRFDSRYFVYTGSAFGPGGFARVDRHREIASGERTARHWHVDYLLGDPNATIDAVWISPGADRECTIASDLPGEPVPGFGASDCDCEAHLVGTDERATLADALDGLHDRRYPAPGSE
jgi:Uri superfamily endonuclease